MDKDLDKDCIPNPPAKKTVAKKVTATSETDRVIDPATGKPYKTGEVPAGKNEPVGGEFVGAEAARYDCERERAERAAKESEDRAKAERERLEKAAADRERAEAADRKKAEDKDISRR